MKMIFLGNESDIDSLELKNDAINHIVVLTNNEVEEIFLYCSNLN